jgi:hypothetical protein
MDENRAPVCYKAECKNGVVYINIGDKTLACNKPGNDCIMQVNGWKWIIIGKYRLMAGSGLLLESTMPNNLQSFCAVPICDNYCEVKECV